MQYHPNYHLLTFYKFVDIDNPIAEVKKHFRFTRDIGMRGRIYISEEGISATATCTDGQLFAYKAFLRENPYFNDLDEQIDSKKTLVKDHQFAKMIVKYRPEIVTLWQQIDSKSFERSVQHLSIDGLKDVIDNKDDERVILDMRNSYEYKLWHFKNAIPAGTINFREVENLLEDYKAQFQDKKVLMYCTWGIRCDKLSVMLKENGIDNFYGLDGGVVNYVNTHNDGNWLGNLYTFDGLVSTHIGDEDTHTTIGECIYSGEKTNHCENCRYSPCNARIIAKKRHYKSFWWFCSQACFDNAKTDGLVKDDRFDEFGYKAGRISVKNWELSQEEFIEQVATHLDNQRGDKNFKHATSQKEELIDKDYLAQWFQDNKWLQEVES